MLVAGECKAQNLTPDLSASQESFPCLCSRPAEQMLCEGPDEHIPGPPVLDYIT